MKEEFYNFKKENNSSEEYKNPQKLGVEEKISALVSRVHNYSSHPSEYGPIPESDLVSAYDLFSELYDMKTIDDSINQYWSNHLEENGGSKNILRVLKNFDQSVIQGLSQLKNAEVDSSLKIDITFLYDCFFYAQNFAKDALYQSEILNETGGSINFDVTALRNRLASFNFEAFILARLVVFSRGNREKVDLKKVAGIDVEIGDGSNITDVEMDRIDAMYEMNHGYTPALKERIKKNMHKDIEDRNSEFVVVRFKNEVIGLCAFKDIDEWTVYFGKFNIDSVAQGAGLGSLVLDDFLEEKAKEKIVKADCDLTNGISRKYIEDGFIAYQSNETEEIIDASIVRNDKEQNIFESKNLSNQMIMDSMNWTNPHNATGVVGERIETFSTPINGVYSSHTLASGLHLDKIGETRSDGNVAVLTRYFEDKSRRYDDEFYDRGFFVAVIEYVDKAEFSKYLGNNISK